MSAVLLKVRSKHHTNGLYHFTIYASYRRSIPPHRHAHTQLIDQHLLIDVCEVRHVLDVLPQRVVEDDDVARRERRPVERVVEHSLLEWANRAVALGTKNGDGKSNW